jgi:hypothetical protein
MVAFDIEKPSSSSPASSDGEKNERDVEDVALDKLGRLNTATTEASDGADEPRLGLHRTATFHFRAEDDELPQYEYSVPCPDGGGTDLLEQGLVVCFHRNSPHRRHFRSTCQCLLNCCFGHVMEGPSTTRFPTYSPYVKCSWISRSALVRDPSVRR